jgi:transcriptional regulator with XRE-family HTH domain
MTEAAADSGLPGFLVARRKAAGWTQEDLAGRSGVSVRTIRNLESGAIRNPRPASVSLLLESLAGGPPAAAPGPPAGRPARAPLTGRDADLGRLAAAVSAGRLVVVTGPGGVGKSRLAAAAADHLRESFEGRVALVSLGSVAPEAKASPASATQVRVLLRAAAGPPPPRGRPALLVIDGAEHVIGSVARAAEDLLAARHGLHLIVTSRRLLPSVTGQVLEVGPLESGAPELFLFHARASCPGLDLGGRRAAVAELCQKLDAMPAAIDIAGRLIRSVPLDTMLSCAPIADLIGRVESGGLPHQRTLARSLQWSYDLLTTAQQELLHHLAQWPRPFTADRLARLPRAGPADGRAAALLAGLAEASLVQVRRGPVYQFSMLAIVRELVSSASAPSRSSCRLASASGTSRCRTTISRSTSSVPPPIRATRASRYIRSIG